MARFALFFVLLVFTAPAAWADALDSARAAVDELNYDHGDIAVHLYTHAIQSGELSNKDLSSVLNGRGVAYLLNKQYELAIRDLNEALRLKPGYATALCNRGAAYLGKEEYTKAKIDLDESLRINPDYALAWNNRGVVYTKLGDYNQAIRDLNEAIRRDPNDPNAWYHRGLAYSNSGDYDKAIRDYDESLRIASGSEGVDVVREAREEAYRLKNQ